jgi:hypothetical protein
MQQQIRSISPAPQQRAAVGWIEQQGQGRPIRLQLPLQCQPFALRQLLECAGRKRRR